MNKRYPHIVLPPELEIFRKNYLAATEVEGTLFGILTCYKMYGQYFARSKSSLTGKRVKQDKRFLRTMHNARVMALASKLVSPVYNSLTEDWRCHDLCRKLVGVGVKLLHQGATKEAVVQAVWAELERLGYKTEWPVWELPPDLADWKEREIAGEFGEALAAQPTTPAIELATTKPPKVARSSIWVVNVNGQLILTRQTSHQYFLPRVDSVPAETPVTYLNMEMGMPP